MVVAQIQVGGDIDGMGDWFGTSVSLSADGNRLALSVPGYNYLTGQVRVYQWSGTDWQQLGAFIDGEAYDDRFGSSVSLSSDGNRLAIGASENDGAGGAGAGHTRVYEWSGTWTQIGADIDGEADYDRSGYAVSLSADGNRVAVGADLNDGDDGNRTNSGHVRVWEWSGTAWEQMGEDIDGEAAGDSQHSISLSADGNRLAIGAGTNDGNGSDAGHVRIFEWTGNAWVQLGADIDGEARYDYSGNSVSLSADGSRVAVGALQNDGNGAAGSSAGHVRIHQWTGTEWSQLGGDIDGAAAYDSFGHAVSLSADGDRLAISALLHDGATGIDSGQVRVYQWSGSAWTQLGANIDGEAPGDRSGHAVSLAANGSRLAISSIENDGNAGHVRVFSLSMFNPFRFNVGLNDAWYYRVTDGQGFFITVFPDLGKVTLAWFTYDTELPPQGATANLGNPGHRWLTALGRYEGNQATMGITFASGGIFDTQTEITRVKEGTIILTFDSCSAGTVEYDIPSLGLSGIVPIERVVGDNIALCEALLTQ